MKTAPPDVAMPPGKLPWLILPIETKVRELDGKLLLGAMAAERGWGVLIGHKDELADDSQNMGGIVLEKDGHIGNARIARYKATGKLVCAMDEEGLVYLNGQDYFRRRLSEGSLQRLDLFFLWGEAQKHDVEAHVRGLDLKLVLTGNPRFDLLRPEWRGFYSAEAAHLKERFGRFLLINTNFADSNHFMGTEWVIQQYRKTGFIASKEQEAHEREFIGYQAGIFHRFLSVTEELSLRYPQLTIIVRPHPSEDHRKWNAVARRFPNVKVIHEGDVNPWLLASNLTIHNSCMTGIHAFLLEQPTIAFMPSTSDEFDLFLPNALSTRVDSTDSLFREIDRLLAGTSNVHLTGRNAQVMIAERYITAMRGQYACDRILDALERLAVDPCDYQPLAARPNDAARRKGRLGGLARGAGFARSWRRLSDRRHLAYSRQKYPGMTLEETHQKVVALGAVSGRFADVRLWQHGRQSFCMVRR